MDGNTELLNYVYQNSQMGVETIDQLLDIIEDGAFKKQLTSQKGEYREINEEAEKLLNENGYDEKGISAFDKIRSYLMINIQTLADKSTSHVAEMMLTGSNMGIINAIRNIKKYDDADKNILNLMKKLLRFEENNMEKLKEFL